MWGFVPLLCPVCFCDPNISWFNSFYYQVDQNKQSLGRCDCEKMWLSTIFLYFKKQNDNQIRSKERSADYAVIKKCWEQNVFCSKRQSRKFHLKHFKLRLEKAHHLSSSSTSTMWSSWFYWHLNGIMDDNHVSSFSCWFNVSKKHHHHFYLEKWRIIIPEEDDPGSESSVTLISSERWTERLKLWLSGKTQQTIFWKP